jgi:hypothetical protein
VIPALSSLKALQHIDSAADDARKRLDEMPAARDAIEQAVADATATVDAVKARLTANHEARRALEKDVAGVDSRLARFDDHKAAVKTNQEFTALLSEIDTARKEKDAVEERILLLLEEADAINRDLAAAQAAVAQTRSEGDEASRALEAERAALDAVFGRLAGERKGELADIPAPLLTRYEQLRSNRRGVAVAAMVGETCSACFVRLRPHVVQQIRRNDEIVQCESCQRILYFDPPADA